MSRLSSLQEVALKKSIKMICCDLDGTLLNSKKEISQANLDAVALAQKQGIYVTICSGRLPTMLQLYAQQLSIQGPLIACNGALIINPVSDQIIEHHSMDMREVTTLLDYCQANDLDYSLLSLKDSYFSGTSKRRKQFEYYNQKAKQANLKEMSLKTLRDNEWQSQIFYKMLIYENHYEAFEETKKFITENTSLIYTSSDNGLLDVSAANVSKGAGVTALAQHLNIGLDEICVVGDWINDISMFEVAHMGIAMRNAHEDLKQYATEITLSNDDDGVAYAIHHYIAQGSMLEDERYEDQKNCAG